MGEDKRMKRRRGDRRQKADSRKQKAGKAGEAAKWQCQLQEKDETEKGRDGERKQDGYRELISKKQLLPTWHFNPGNRVKRQYHPDFLT